MADQSFKSPGQPAPERPFLGILMKCCRTYSRAYLNDTRTEYAGRCPRCGAFVRVAVVKEGGSSDRFFEAG